MNSTIVLSGKNHVRRLLLFVIMVVAGAPFVFPQAGKSGLAFLKLGVSGRSVAMGDAMSASVQGAAATHYNPAGLLGVESPGTQLLFMHKEWIQDVRSEFLGASITLGEADAVGFALNTTTVSDIEIRTRPGTAEGTFTSRDLSFGASYARSFSDELRIGLSAKLLYEKILVTEATGYAFDVGAQYRTSVEGLLIGAALSNLGTVSAMQSEKITLPSLLRLGPAYSFGLNDISSDVTLAADLLHIFPEKKSYLNLGGEFIVDKLVAARLGFQLGSTGRGFSAGIGVKHGIFALDYGFTPLAFDLGTGHTFSLALNL